MVVQNPFFLDSFELLLYKLTFYELIVLLQLTKHIFLYKNS